MFDKMKQLMDMKKQADRIKKDLDQMTVEVTSVPGLKLVVTGSQDFRSITIEEGLLSDPNKLQQTILRGVNAAIKESQKMAAQKMASMMPAGF